MINERTDRFESGVKLLIAINGSQAFLLVDIT